MCHWVTKKERERERETDRQKDRQKDRQTDRQKDRKKERKKERKKKERNQGAHLNYNSPFVNLVYRKQPPNSLQGYCFPSANVLLSILKKGVLGVPAVARWLMNPTRNHKV